MFCCKSTQSSVTSAIVVCVFLYFATQLPSGSVQTSEGKRIRIRFQRNDAKPELTNRGDKTESPVVIGILTEILNNYERFTTEPHLFIVSSYVKWIESAGAQVLPILLNQDDAYYERIFNQTNGLLFPGGDNPLNPRKGTPMLKAAKKLFQLALEANDRGQVYPVWGTCLGMELLSVLSSGRNVLEQCSSTDVALKLDFVQRGRLFAPASYAGLMSQVDYARSIAEALSNHNLTYNFHHKCLTDAGFREAKLAHYYRPLAYSTDLNGLRFIAAFEAIGYPFYGVQFHPEKAPFEFVRLKGQVNIMHSRQAVAVSRYFADFFIAAASAGNTNSSGGLPADQDKLIYSYSPLYTAPMRDMYEQRYLFPYNKTVDADKTFRYIL